jgi:adenine deaminase
LVRQPIVADMTDLAAFIHSLPKAELHVHLEGCITPEQVVAIGRRNGVGLFERVEAARAAYDVPSLDSFLQSFAKASEVLLLADDFAEVASAYFDSAVAEGVRHVELMFDPQAHTIRGVAIETVLEGLEKARDSATRNDLSTLLIVNFMRERDEEEALELLESLEPYRSQIVALGIDSVEIGHPPRKFARLFQEARTMGLKLVAHAGFEGPLTDIEEAIDILHVNRVDHGNRIYEKPELARRVGDAGAAVTVCPRAEVQLAVVASLSAHPVRRMLADGLRPSVNSDDPAWFGSLTENYIALVQEGALTRTALLELVRNSFTTSFLPASSVSTYLAELEAKADSNIQGVNGPI